MTVSRPLHVCLVCNTAWAIHTYRPGLIKALLAQGARVTVLAPYDRTFAPLQAWGVTCIDVPIHSKGTNPLADLKTLVTLWRHYWALKPDMAFHYTIKANIYGTIAAALARVKSIAVTTGLGYVFIQRSRAAQVAKQLYKIAFRFPHEVWFLNPDDHRTFVDAGLLVHPERAELLRSEGIDLEQFPLTPIAAGKPDFVFILVGRLLWDKGVAEYVAAARAVKARYPQARFQLLGPVGVANPSAISKQEVEQWVAEGVVEWLGETDDVRPYLSAADCVVLPSYREGMPRTLLEASALGRPIVATRVPGCRDVVEDGVTGLLCEVRSADDLAAKMLQMLEMSAQQRAHMGELGRARMQAEFDERLIIQRYFAALTTHTGVRFEEKRPS
ncbi:glycosyltransferase family 4 protein [Burkholderia sp. L27(2015)]|uniref:glycosyltransferase family 4 protein n=1 Tax=Burkholderia sp. L27(2015) TaxID=1641858 RepID=UPI00131E2FA6|nr:glycosyltransferase family 4 protein [Burkholderia sp. L27(2015)]